MKVVSVDLAYRHYRDFGVVVLEGGCGPASYRPVELTSLHAITPEPAHTANLLIELCQREGASLLLLDGPQGWKSPDNGLVHSRVCERLLNTPAKSGLPGTVKPANYLPFVRFSIDVFDELHAQGWCRFDPACWSPNVPTVAESFPLSAWRCLGLRALPAKSNTREDDIRDGLDALVSTGLVLSGPLPTHDQLQAVVAGVVGRSLLVGHSPSYQVPGMAPFFLDGSWREGFIINPVGRCSGGASVEVPTSS